MKDLKGRDTWMVFKIMGEFVEGFETLRDLGPAVSIFGGARFKEGDPTYRLAVDVAERLANAGYAVITGGGPGVMEAANRGAALAGAKSVGLNIKLPFEQGANPFANIKIDFDYFFARKVMFMRYAQAYVCLPGGFGTLDEVSEALTLIQTAKIRNFPVVLVGRKFWRGLVEWLKDSMIPMGTIAASDLSLFSIVDDPDEVVEAVEKGRKAFLSSRRNDAKASANGKGAAGGRKRSGAAGRGASKSRR
jgi:uncharacterized protein (TIGR00730 family)